MLESIKEILAVNVRRYRGELKMTQAELASKAEVSKNTIQQIEDGAVWVGADSLPRLAKALNIEPWQLLKPPDPPPINDLPPISSRQMAKRHPIIAEPKEPYSRADVSTYLFADAIDLLKAFEAAPPVARNLAISILRRASAGNLSNDLDDLLKDLMSEDKEVGPRTKR